MTQIVLFVEDGALLTLKWFSEAQGNVQEEQKEQKISHDMSGKKRYQHFSRIQIHLRHSPKVRET